MQLKDLGAISIPEYRILPPVQERLSVPSDEDAPKYFGIFENTWPDVAGQCTRVFLSISPSDVYTKKKTLVVHMAPGRDSTPPPPFPCSNPRNRQTSEFSLVITAEAARGSSDAPQPQALRCRAGRHVASHRDLDRRYALLFE